MECFKVSMFANLFSYLCELREWFNEFTFYFHLFNSLIVNYLYDLLRLFKVKRICFLTDNQLFAFRQNR